MFYLIIFFLLSIASLLELTDISMGAKLMLFISAILILFCLAGLRFETGGDWTSYTDFFLSVEPFGKVVAGQAPVFNESYMEIGYKIFNSIVKSFGGGIQTVFFLIALLNSFILCLALKEYLRYPITGLLIYFGSLFFSLDLIVIRQCIAVLLFFYGIKFIYQRKFLNYLIIIIVASLFHRSAILLIPAYFFLKKGISRRRYIYIFIFFLAIYCFHVEWVKPILLGIAHYVGGTNALIIENYITSPVYGVNRILSVGVFVNIFLFCLYILNFNKLKESKYFFCFFNLFILNLFIYFACYEVIEIADRYRYYFLISNVVLLPSLLVIYNRKSNKLAILALCSLFAFFYGRNIFLESPSGAAYNPYQNYLIHEIFDTRSNGRERLEKSDEVLLKSRER